MVVYYVIFKKISVKVDIIGVELLFIGYHRSIILTFLDFLGTKIIVTKTVKVVLPSLIIRSVLID